MKLMFAISRTGSDEVTRLTVAEKEVTAGDSPKAVIRLPGLPETIFTIARLDDGIMVLERHNESVAIIVDGDALTKDSVHVRNGTEIDVEDYRILLTVSFDRAEYSSRNSLAVMVSAVLIIAILLTEAVIVHWLPKQIQKSQFWGAEILRQSTLHSLDMLRGTIAGNLSKETDDPYLIPTLRLYKNETDMLAIYARENQDKMTVEQLTQLDDDLKRLNRQVELLIAGKLIPTPETIDVGHAVESMVNEKEH